MRVPPSFFREPPVEGLLQRAAKAAAVPMCLHGGDGLRIAGWGECESCRWINELLEGKSACRDARRDAAELAKRQHIPVTFVCHLGYTCVIVSALEDTGYTVVFGPYIPLEASGEIEHVVKRGVVNLRGVSVDAKKLPFSLEDVRLAPQGAVHAVAEWLVEGLKTALAAYVKADSQEEEEADAIVPTSLSSAGAERRKSKSNRYPAIVALSLLCGRDKDAQRYLAEALSEYSGTAGDIRTRVIKVLSDILHEITRMGGDSEKGWLAYKEFIAASHAVEDGGQLQAGAGRMFRLIARACASHFDSSAVYMKSVTARMHEKYPEEKLLTELARDNHVAPSTITRMLEKLTGAKFSEVLGHIRVFHAKQLLRDTTLSATEIAEQVGIHDQSNFGKLFKQYCGITPGAYRARHQKQGVSASRKRG